MMDTSNIGSKIRAFRKKKKLSLNQLSQITGIAASNLSHMELGKSSPTISTLWKIAEAFNMKPSVFLDEILYKQAIFRPAGGRSLERDQPGISFKKLTEDIWLNRIDCTEISIEPGRSASLENPAATDRIVYCLEGSVEAISGEDRFLLQPGDSLYLQPEADLTVSVSGSTTTRLLLVSLMK